MSLHEVVLVIACLIAGVGGAFALEVLVEIWEVLYPDRMKRIVAWVINHWPPYRKRLLKIGAPETHPHIMLPTDPPKYRVVPADRYDGYNEDHDESN